jgi:RNA polymerase primary sigma factor
MYAVPVSRRDDEDSTLGAYLREIGKLPRLSVDEERVLGARVQRDHDQAAMMQLVEGNLRFVVSYAKRYRRHGVSFLDLIHEGNLGLMEAARRFDPAHNVKFITYAAWWVRQSMMHVLADSTRAFSFPPRLFGVLHAGGPESEDVSLSDSIGDRVSLEAPVEDELIRRSDRDELAAALRDLDGKEQKVMRLRYGLGDGEPRTLQEVGDRLHLTRERVRQIESIAKEKLRRSSRLRSHLN